MSHTGFTYTEDWTALLTGLGVPAGSISSPSGLFVRGVFEGQHWVSSTFKKLCPLCQGLVISGALRVDLDWKPEEPPPDIECVQHFENNCPKVLDFVTLGYARLQR